MTPLRAFLMLRDVEGIWQVQVHHELDGLVRSWEQRQDTRTTAVVHVGFERSPTRVFDALAVQFEGQVLLTASARYSLPSHYEATRRSIADVDGVPIFLATRGWGYEVSPDVGAIAAEAFLFEGWLVKFVNANPEAIEALSAFGIRDDANYLLNENRLPFRLRHCAGIFRLRDFVGADPDPCALAGAAPPWLQAQAFSDLSITVRVSNVLTRLGIKIVADLARLTVADLLQTANFGRTSAKDLLSSLDSALNAGPKDQQNGSIQIYDVTSEDQRGGSIETQDATLLAALNRSFISHATRDQDILRRRMGLDGPAETLAEIGEHYNVTRERIRQIEARSVRRLVTKGIWNDLLTSKLQSLLEVRTYPLPLLGLEAVDPWFTGMAKQPFTLRYLLANVSHAGASIFEIDGLEYLALINQEQWTTTVAEARRLLAGGVGQNWTESHCKYLVSGLLPPKSPEFCNLLWSKAAALCHFVEEDGHRVFKTYGRGAEQVVEAVLEEAEAPLHYTAIAERVARKSGRRIDLRLAHGAAANVGLLFGRGTYGVWKHLALSASEVNDLANRAEDIVALGPSDRQWHSSEMIAMLADQGWAGPAADKYALDAVLSARGTLQSLGRMVWAQRISVASDAVRIDVRQSIISTLQAAGRPLPAGEIRQRLVASRGLNHQLQILVADPILRVAPGTWGLNDRDVAIKRPDQHMFLESLADRLHSLMKGLHISEMAEVIREFPGLTPEATFSLATQDERLRTSAGQYLYLRSWGEPRRETVLEVVRAILLEQPSVLSYEGLLTVVQRRVGRVCARSALTRALQAVGAIQDGSGRWRFGNEQDELDFSTAEAENLTKIVVISGQDNLSQVMSVNELNYRIA